MNQTNIIFDNGLELYHFFICESFLNLLNGFVLSPPSFCQNSIFFALLVSFRLILMNESEMFHIPLHSYIC